MFHFSVLLRQVGLKHSCARWMIILILLICSTGTAGAQMTFTTILHDVQIAQVPGELAYTINLYVSVLDENNLPINDLKPENFSVLQDSVPLPFTVNDSSNEGISLVLLVDTSGSMAGQGIEKAREALKVFIEQLAPNDSVAIITFNSELNTLSDFTNDKTSLLHQVETIVSVPNAGTCMYDALYQAVEMASLIPLGRRAVVVLTDGRDELPNGGICSSAKIDDVIHTASGNIHTPIYSIAVGKSVDENSLQRLALLTGGSLLKSNDFSQLILMFETLQDQLKNQYLLSFVSKAPTGDHSITVKTIIGNNTDTVTREIRLPDPGPIIQISSPVDGDTLTTTTDVQLSFLGKTDKVDKVLFNIDGVIVGESSSSPYEFLIDPANLPAQNSKLTVIVIDSEGKVLSTDSINFIIPASIPTEALPTSDGVKATSKSPITIGTAETQPRVLVIIGVVVAALILLIALVLLVLKPFKHTKAPAAIGMDISDATSEATFDSVLPISGMREQQNCSGILTVIFSDDRDRIGEKIIVDKPVTQIGRSSTNDIAFPKDHPVSRRHAVLEFKDGQFQLSEALTGDESGMKAPTFGSFVNDENLGGAPVLLRSGDEIRLGNRLRLRFDVIEQPIRGNSFLTMDQ